VTGQSFSFYDVRTEYDARFAKRLSLQLYHQFFSNTTVSQVTVSQPTTAKGLFAPAPQEARAAMTAAPIVDVAVAAETGWTDPTAPLTTLSPTGSFTGMFRPASPIADRSITLPSAQSVEVATHSSTFGAQLSYALIPSVTVGGGVSVSAIAPPDGPLAGLFEQATRLVDAQASLTWGQRIGIVNARAGGTYGRSSATSTSDQRGSAPFYSASGGLSVGNTNRVLVWADANYLHREDVYMANGYANEKAYSAGIEVQLLQSLHFTGSAGFSNFDEITNDGHEVYRRTLYSLGLEHRIASFQFSQSTNVGDRNVFSVPFDQGIGRLFYLLPVDSLVPDPFGRTWSRFTQGVARFRLVRNLDLEARYIDNDSRFVLAQDISGRQLEVLATYRLGRFTFRAGALLERLSVESAPDHKRTQYFARVSRSFRIF
jgi:hypothetical protein